MPVDFYGTVSIDQREDPAIQVLRFERPAMRNALTCGMLRELTTAVRASAVRRDLVCTIITGGARHFSSGLDLNEVKAGKAEELVSCMQQLTLAIRATRSVVVSLVSGHCYAGGLLIALSSDMVVAWPDALFAAPETRMGLVPAALAWAARNRMTWPGVRAHWLTGEPFDAPTARSYGLVHKLLDAGVGFEEGISTTARLFARADPGVLAATKETLARIERSGTHNGEVELDELMQLSREHFPD